METLDQREECQRLYAQVDELRTRYAHLERKAAEDAKRYTEMLAALTAERDELRAQLAPTWIPVDESKRIMCACPDEGCYRAVEWDGTNLTIYVDVSEFDAGLPSLFTMIDLPENVRLCELTPPA